MLWVLERTISMRWFFWAPKLIQTRMRSLWVGIATPHTQVFDPQHPQLPTLGYDPGDRMKIWFDMFYILYLLEHIQIFEIDFVIEI